MRRLLLAFFAFVLLGILLALVFRDHQGYVLVVFNGWQVQTSFLFACAAVIVGFWLLLTLWRILAGLFLAPRNLQSFLGRRRRRKQLRSQHDGLVYMNEAHWKQAENVFKSLAADNAAPDINYLLSARVAHYRTHLAARDQYLNRAAADKNTSRVALLMTRAELQFDAGQHDEAQGTLEDLYKLEPHHPWGLRLLAENAVASDQYDWLYEHIDELPRHAALSSQRLTTVTQLVYEHKLAQQSNIDGLTAIWRQVPKSLRQSTTMVASYARCLVRLDADDEAANMIRHVLENQWDGQLVELFGNLQCSDRKAQLASVENWIKNKGRQQELLMAAGRLCQRDQLWGRAQSYFEELLARQPDAAALFELGKLHEQAEDWEQARLAYRQGLVLQTTG